MGTEPSRPLGRVPFKIRATGWAQRDPAYERFFAPSEVEDARVLRALLEFAEVLERWPPEAAEDWSSNDFGFASHITGGAEVFSWRATGDRGDRRPPLRVFFYVRDERAERVAYILHVVEERMIRRCGPAVVACAIERARDHRSRRGAT